jgi:chemotaxis protein MotA
VAKEGREREPKDRNLVKAITAIGIGATFAILLVAVMMEGGNPMAFIDIPAFLIVVGGTTGATVASTSFSALPTAAKTAKLAFTGVEIDHVAASSRMVKHAEKARKEGLLALENDLADLDDEYTKKGLQLVVDGADSDLVRSILQSEVDGMAERHSLNAKFFATAGGFAPTLGILGTVMALVHVLEHLDAPASLGKAISGAFIATLYGVGSANLIFLPLSNKLKEISSAEVDYRTMLLEGILSIQAGDNPRLLAEKLETFIPPAERAGAKAASKAKAKANEPVEAEPPPAAEAAAA